MCVWTGFLFMYACKHQIWIKLLRAYLLTFYNVFLVEYRCHRAYFRNENDKRQCSLYAI